MGTLEPTFQNSSRQNIRRHGRCNHNDAATNHPPVKGVKGHAIVKQGLVNGIVEHDPTIGDIILQQILDSDVQNPQGVTFIYQPL